MKFYIIILKGDIILSINCDNFKIENDSINFKKDNEIISSIFKKDIKKIIDENRKELYNEKKQ